MSATAYITFRLAGETFAIPVTHVQEVLDWEEITPLPMAPPYVLGMVTLRGTPIPIIDLRSKFSMPKAQHTLTSRIVILEFTQRGKPCLVGGLADAVLEVVEFSAEAVNQPPSVGDQWHSELVEGTALHNGTLVMLLRVEALFSGNKHKPAAQIVTDAPAG